MMKSTNSLTKEQREFWDNLRAPTERSCYNCKWLDVAHDFDIGCMAPDVEINDTDVGILWKCIGYYSGDIEYYVKVWGDDVEDHWEWDEKNS